MNPNDNKPNFMDRGTITAILVMLVFWFGWTKYMEAKYPQSSAKPAAVKAADGKAEVPSGTAPAGDSTTSTQGTASQADAGKTAPDALGDAKKEELIDFDSESMAFHFSTKGMGFRDIDIKKYKTRTDAPIILGGVHGDYPFATHLIGLEQPLDFTIEHSQPNVFVGHAKAGDVEIEKTMTIDPVNYSVDTNIKVTGNLEKFRGISTSLSEQIQIPEAGGILGSSSREYQDWYIRHDNTKTRKMLSLKDGTQLAESNVTLAALSTHYFSIAVADKSDILPKFESTVAPNAQTATGRLLYQPISHVDTFTVHYLGYAGPKSLEILGRVDEGLTQIVDYGIFGFLGRPILWLLKFLYSVVGNWGFAIVLLTLIVRAIVLPFNAYSYKSMKAMQRIQPEMTRIRERYKDKPNDQKLQMNQEIMKLMKDNKASPVGGCLPTLLQLPPFFALYQVLGQSIELYRAPFILWIHDLSARDPYFVLPVLMGATMFIQQRLTPTTMDPQQAKIMMWMPLIFSVFMISLPSGLTLYIFISTLFGITQQYFFMRNKSTVQSHVKEAKA